VNPYLAVAPSDALVVATFASMAWMAPYITQEKFPNNPSLWAELCQGISSDPGAYPTWLEVDPGVAVMTPEK
jgi:hypothetical protein